MATITGTAVGETLTGTRLQDEIFGLGGDDTIRGRAGNDTIDGGTEQDVLIGRTGSDNYFVDSEFDRVLERLGEGDNDTVFATVSFILRRNIENLELRGEAVRGKGNDLDNRITVEAGQDVDNILEGRGGNDILNGGAGDDTLVGGHSAGDTFVFDDGESGFEQTYTDYIQGFQNRNEVRDIIDLSQIDADTTQPGDQSFTYLSQQQNFSGTPGEVKIFGFEGYRYQVQGDVDGDKVMDFFIVVQGDGFNTQGLSDRDLIL